MSSPRHSTGGKGIRSGHWSGSKFTNLTVFDPSYSELRAVWHKYYNKIHNTVGLTVIVQPTHPDFIMPLNEEDVRRALAAVPKKFIAGLHGVVLLGGSRKQAKAFRNLFAFGCYTSSVIFLHPFPRQFLNQREKYPPKPNTRHDYERAGANITRDGKDWWIRFDEKSLKQFYLRDVLLHELGHHVDSKNFRFKTDRKAESFAEWFASEYGYKLGPKEND